MWCEYQLLKQLEALARQALPSTEEQEQQVSAVLHAGCSVLWGRADGNSPSLLFCLLAFISACVDKHWGIVFTGKCKHSRAARRALLQGRMRETGM